MKQRKLIIVDHNGGRLGNQLWNIANLYAYCLERSFTLRNYSFYQYDRSFQMVSFSTIADFFLKHAPSRMKRKVHTLLRRAILTNPHSIKIYALGKEDVPVRFYLPPSDNPSSEQNTLLRVAEAASTPLYTFGWMFRNPTGLDKYRKEIVQYMRPSNSIRKKTAIRIATLRKQYTTLVGVHIRQGDYTTYAGGSLLFSPNEVRSLLDSYIQETGKDIARTLFVLCSDTKLDTTAFTGLHHTQGDTGPIEDMYLLSQTDRIIGSNSTFGGFAAWYGNIPITVFSHQKIDWKQEETRRHFEYNRAPSTMQP